MAIVEVRAVSPERYVDATHALTGGGEGGSCRCQWWMLTSTQWRGTTAVDREQLLHDEIEQGPPPALIAYVDDEPAGWVRVGPRVGQSRIVRTRAYAALSGEAMDDPSVWSISCFVVRREYRGMGLAAQLLDAAVAHAREHGARVIEAYPMDPAAKKLYANNLFTGTLSMFVDAGFSEVARPRPYQAIVVLPTE
ncbi:MULTISPECIES: GNAT family N-acetyltransferase [Mycobacteriaceae]|uniref:Acetyltransferase n=1 Tax=Mycolicibacterium neoaurum VKM Ac-1815D TaxID=700508 RepID=V5X8V2_MYCNE|nr:MULTISPECIES: GNAT family N-acetyltransferase [Mycobacteriaceae]AHC24885.1 acetyltransferase [Mycolicibacterium neoaurum VKM Ac-1815D]AMO05427.1 acetyltransferase [Mycolicibacterium neoaurum]AXK76256.1 GNAT family N-acetyltransferase [Mycolicibacterium neoaurum]KJQ50729.1 acetyltransferase [Mycolicibacterium neoaurum]KUM09917.1 acetyltransferase [Mycolicibacterium neoaurum]